LPNRRKLLTQYLLIHLALLLYGAFVLLWSLVSKRLGVDYFCLSHDLFGIYCPFCGGTRALSALLRFDLPSALAYNTAFVLTLPLLLFFDARALSLIFCDRVKGSLFPRPMGILVAVIFAVYFVVRNLLVFAFGVDFVGDFQ
jgi:hypothetical protein